MMTKQERTTELLALVQSKESDLLKIFPKETVQAIKYHVMLEEGTNELAVHWLCDVSQKLKHLERMVVVLSVLMGMQLTGTALIIFKLLD